MPQCPFEVVLRHDEKFALESGSCLELTKINVTRVVPGWSKPLELMAYYDLFGAEQISTSLWSSNQLYPHSAGVELKIEAGCKIGSEGADLLIVGKMIKESSQGSQSRTVERNDDDSCVLL